MANFPFRLICPPSCSSFQGLWPGLHVLTTLDVSLGRSLVEGSPAVRARDQAVVDGSSAVPVTHSAGARRSLLSPCCHHRCPELLALHLPLWLRRLLRHDGPVLELAAVRRAASRGLLGLVLVLRRRAAVRIHLIKPREPRVLARELWPLRLEHLLADLHVLLQCLGIEGTIARWAAHELTATRGLVAISVPTEKLRRRMKERGRASARRRLKLLVLVLVLVIALVTALVMMLVLLWLLMEMMSWLRNGSLQNQLLPLSHYVSTQ